MAFFSYSRSRHTKVQNILIYKNQNSQFLIRLERSRVGFGTSLVGLRKSRVGLGTTPFGLRTSRIGLALSHIGLATFRVALAMSRVGLAVIYYYLGKKYTSTWDISSFVSKIVSVTTG